MDRIARLGSRQYGTVAGSPGGPTGSVRWCQTVGLFLVLCLASSRFSWGALARGDFVFATEYVYYQAATLGFNYPEFGAVRRGLGGTIVHWLGPAPLLSTILFHLLSAAAVAATAAMVFHRQERRGWARTAFAMVMLVIMLRWGDDAGRTDMLVAALLGAAALCVQRGRPVLASLLVCIGLFVHESSFIFGLPLLAALLWQRGGTASLAPHQRRGIGGVFAATLALYLGMAWLPHADIGTMVQVVRAKFEPHIHVEWAMYFALSGLRGVQTSICQNLTDPSNWVHPASGLVVLAVAWGAAMGARRVGLGVALLAALPGFVFLCVVANDTSRWAMFALFNLWLVAAALPTASPSAAIPGRPFPNLQLLLALLLGALVLPRPASISFRIYAPSPTLEWAVRKLGGARTPDIEEALLRCDPNWRDVLDGKAAR